MVKTGALTHRFTSALTMASVLHRGQERKGSSGRPIPYVGHLLEVASIVLAESVPEDVAIAALLHDAPEDQGGIPTLDLIREAFGHRVADMIAECTDTFEDPKPEWIPRKTAYLDRLRSVDDWDVLLIKCADCLSNARATLDDHRDIGEEVWKRFKNMPCATNQRWWYATVREALRPLGRSVRAFAQLHDVVSRLLAETVDCPGCIYFHLTAVLPEIPGEDEDWDMLAAGGFDTFNRCPTCAHVPMAPADGSGRMCPNCGHRWTLRTRVPQEK